MNTLSFQSLIFWRDARVVEWARLERECARKGTEGSNPSLSALIPLSLEITSRQTSDGSLIFKNSSGKLYP